MFKSSSNFQMPYSLGKSNYLWDNTKKILFDLSGVPKVGLKLWKTMDVLEYKQRILKDCIGPESKDNDHAEYCVCDIQPEEDKFLTPF